MGSQVFRQPQESRDPSHIMGALEDKFHYSPILLHLFLYAEHVMGYPLDQLVSGVPSVQCCPAAIPLSLDA